ncbi:hypothetical protein LCGC14_0849700 [marine sediment metagenome]|uniref:Restriction endonuclease n=1 Tax=marine sediment metagenome TaxID=412755 RepID=A0A0F9PVY6_9ZZZZ
MKIVRNLIILSEYESVTFEELRKELSNSFKDIDSEKEVLSIINQITLINKKLGIKIIKLLWDKLKATQYVGFIRLRNFVIQIIPKIFQSDDSKNLEFLTYMIEYLNKQIISMKNLDIGLIDSVKGNLFEYYIYLFVKSLRDFLKSEILKTYVKIKKNDTKFKGKLIISQQIKLNYNKEWKYYCQYDKFTLDNLFNQIIKYVLLLLKIQISVLNIKRYIKEILNYLDDVSYKFITLQDFESLQFDRMNMNYKPFIDFCKLIIMQSTINFNTSNLHLFYFVFDMNRLFEAFLSEFIRKNISKLNINSEYKLQEVQIQHILGRLFNNFGLKCDLLIDYQRNGDISTLLLDFKYKLLSSEKKKLGLSQSDFYQMFAYSQSTNRKFQNIILLYPKSELEKINFNETYEHFIKLDKKIKIFIKSIDLEMIFGRKTRSERENLLVIALNQVLNII